MKFILKKDKSLLLIMILGLVVCACKKEDQASGIVEPVTASIKLQSLPGSETGITFMNEIKEEGKINIFTWHFLYNGAGVAAGDINNDGLPDLYFAGNMVPDRLYLNKGNFKFEDITANSGISTQIWSSGVTMADVNADGLLDIYVCKNSPTGIPDNNRNKLYINQGKNLFREQAAQYGIDDTGFGVQSTFFDADHDGDLDMYLVNQPFDEFASMVNRPEVVAGYPKTDRFLFFENGKFVDKTATLGMQNARYGLNVAIADFDMNGWTDLYICNDYHHADHLYMNDQGKFTDALHLRTGHLSFYSMGADVGDVNMDGWPDIFTLDMAFEEHFKSKTNMGSMDPARFWGLVSDGQHYQYMQNALQVNMGNGYFSEQAQVAGISKSDWSYSTLFADLDLDADQDILITNGILRDLQNNDFNAAVKERYKMMVGPDNYLDVLKILPSNPVPNIIFNNDGNMQFTKLGPEAGFDTPGFSHGMVYTDLDGDGKLDVVINNMNAPAS
ncbi:MAG TPA: VCBS repeat-containing protein, partial [Saprospiraceae bacterium]